MTRNLTESNNAITDGKKNRFSIYTLGCKVNQEEGVALANLFKEQGWQQVAFEEPAEVCIINTCTVTHLADRKSRQFIRRALRANPQAVVAATGCYAQVGKDEIAEIEGVDLIVGTNDRHRMFEYVTEILGQKPKTPIIHVTPSQKAESFKNMGNLNNDTKRERAFLKIEDGCSQFCSYCIIPYARGPVRSRPLADIIAEARELVAKGYGELVLTGIHTGAYGTDLTDGSNLAQVAAALAEIPNLHRLRLGSIEPQEVSDELIEVVATHPNICHHFHIPLQACDNEIISAMNRHYTTEYFEELLAKIRSRLDNVAITTDLIVGFPGESDEIFERSLERLARLKFADMHIFPYSPRRGTPAAEFANQVSPQAKSARVKAVSQLCDQMKKEFWQQQIGRKLEILTEQEAEIDGQLYLTGHSPNYLPLAVLFDDESIAAGKFYQLKITEIKDSCLVGRII